MCLCVWERKEQGQQTPLAFACEIAQSFFPFGNRLGVLQSNSVDWVPAFPDWKREALLSFHMTTYTKIFLRFEHKFWDDWQVWYSTLPCQQHDLWLYTSLHCMLEMIQENIPYGKISMLQATCHIKIKRMITYWWSLPPTKHLNVLKDCLIHK